MNTELTQEKVDFYNENGYVVHENLLTPQELETWRTAVDGAIASRDRRNLPGRDFGATEYYDKIFIQCVNVWQDCPPMKPLVLDERLGKMAAELEGLDGIRMWHDQALYKEPAGNATSWHLDNPYFSFYSRQCITIWIALDDSTLSNGCLYFVPGSHKTATFDNININENMDDLFNVYPDWRKIDPAPTPIPAGSCTFHNGLTAHAAGPNMTTRSRRAIAIGYMPDGAVFNGQQNVLTEEQAKRYKVDEPLDDEAQVPMIYKR